MGKFQTIHSLCKTGEIMVIREAREADAKNLNAMVADVFQSSPYLVTLPEEFSSFTEEQQKERIKKFEIEANHLMLVAEVGDELVGVIDFQNGGRKRISHRGSFGMSAHPRWREKGIGYLLLKGLIDWVGQHPSVELIQLAVMEENTPAVALYKKMGFEITGREPYGLKLADGTFLVELNMSLKVSK
jgi:RimJ/RimL family protein N-acetyltransferase